MNGGVSERVKKTEIKKVVTGMGVGGGDGGGRKEGRAWG